MGITDSSFRKQILVVSFILAIAGRGGAKSTTSGSSPVSIKLKQSTATVVPGQTPQFTATVTGTDNTAVTWTVATFETAVANTKILIAAARDAGVKRRRAPKHRKSV